VCVCVCVLVHLCHLVRNRLCVCVCVYVCPPWASQIKTYTCVRVSGTCAHIYTSFKNGYRDHCQLLDEVAHTATHCNALRHTTIHCTTLSHTDTRTISSLLPRHHTMQHTATPFNTLQQPCNTRRHPATNCNTIEP